MLSSSRVTVGIALLIALITACQSAPPPDFTLTFDTSSLALNQGATADVTVKLERPSGFVDPIAVTWKGLPANITASPATLTMTATDSRATVRLTASSAAAATSSKVTIEGVSGAARKSASVEAQNG